MIFSRKLNPFEKSCLTSDEFILFSLEVENPTFIPSIVNNLKKAIYAFNYKIQGDELIYTPGEIEVHSLPKHIKTCQTSSLYCDEHLLNKYSNGLAAIAANDRIITVTVSHMLYDGGFFVDLYNHLFDDPNHSYYFQSDPERFVTYKLRDMFTEELKRKNLNFLYQQHLSNYKSLQSIPFSATIDADAAGNPRCVSHICNIPAKDLHFSKSKMSLSDMYWTMLPLTCMAFNDSGIEDLGILTCVDMRKFYGSQKVNRLVGLNFIELFLSIGGVDPKMTVRQVGQMFRNKFNEMRNDGTFYGALLNMDNGYPSIKNRLLAEISNVGRFEAKKPISDVFIQQSLNSKDAEWIAGFSSFSRDVHGENTVTIRLERAQTALNNLDGEIMTQSFVHSMRDIPPDVSILKAYDEIRSFQNKVRQSKA
ncbi:hypothetical protein M9Y10_020923 [Tritrichomonas musculus]|uniref:Condensation domain-containing protein n=1 Tax=Tritrichomonas musculus TaxID=1915356 RepID=A0ABR2HG14_9EUKA